jgi:hypothetical protein
MGGGVLVVVRRERTGGVPVDGTGWLLTSVIARQSLTDYTWFAYIVVAGSLAVQKPISGAAMDWLVLEYEFDQPGTIYVRLANGPQQTEIVADIEVGRRRIVLRRLHISGAGPNTMGPAALRRLLRWAKEQRDVDELRIEGAARTSGANPGRFPRALVI